MLFVNALLRFRLLNLGSCEVTDGEEPSSWPGSGDHKLLRTLADWPTIKGMGSGRYVINTCVCLIELGHAN